MSASDELAKLGPLAKLNPEAMTAFGAFDAAAMGDGAVSKKTKELIAVAVALSFPLKVGPLLRSLRRIDYGAQETFRRGYSASAS